ncbi:hypothetical protein O181_111614 [Austropuccinia psidii MF-1]|uniref:Uncharacterized protein n=1 Tax=Austropuccinia psidii MF-1 TaxID=1389203 RepID=A0A9Q3K2B7_9BASI|nr:hypothetical protein [Austropuccinia psidii MF-1]
MAIFGLFKVPVSYGPRSVSRGPYASVCGGPIPVGGRPTYSSSEDLIYRINTDSVVKRIQRISDSTPDPDAEGSDELDGEEVEVAPHSVGHPSSTSSSQPLANRFHSHIIPSTPSTFQPTSLPPHARPALNQ